MNWPFVSRTAYDAVCSERDRLREQVDRLMDHVMRLERAAKGLPELAPVHRKTLEPMPQDIDELIRKFDGADVQEDLRRRATNLARRKGWDAAREVLQREIGADG